MLIVSRWRWGRAAKVVAEALGAGAAEPVAVVDHPALARLLAEGRQVTQVVARPRRGAREAQAELPPEGNLAAVVGAGAGSRDDWQAALAVWSAAVRDGGTVVLVDAGARAELCRRALAAGLRDIEQRVAGGTVVTSGRVKRL